MIGKSSYKYYIYNTTFLFKFNKKLLFITQKINKNFLFYDGKKIKFL